MRICVFSRAYSSSYRDEIQTILEFVEKHNGKVLFCSNIQKEVKSAFNLPCNTEFYELNESIENRADLVVSLGGDGTLLETVNFIKDSQVPVLGVNFGRLGFLSNTPKEEFRFALEAFHQGNFSLSKRTVLEIDDCATIFGSQLYALNDIALHKNDGSSMITVQTYINDDFMNSYWSDGIIISTPTGSTAYSLSCGGPILVPGANNLILTPIAPHNLSVRPVVISDDKVVTLIPDGRSDNFVLSLDSNQTKIQKGQKITIRKANFTINFVRQADDSFFKVLREKLMWGEDKRNL
jgi:NAD+ kinase